MSVKVNVDVRLSGKVLGRIFARLSSTEQAEFFEAASDECDEWRRTSERPIDVDAQWYYMAKDATLRQKEAMRRVSCFAWEFWNAHLEAKEREYWQRLAG